jgi:hypothetical protein
MTACKMLIWILWPSFVVAGIAEGIFFTLFDPTELTLLDAPIEASRTAIYSIGFFAFWAFAAASSALTCFFQRTSTEINRRGLRPAHSPDRDGPRPTR